MSESTAQDQNRALFSHLVISLAQSALMGLGKVIHPATQKAEVNLESAQQAIDLLDMLESKTKGNLDPEESNMLKQALGMLKLNFVEVANSSPASSPEHPASSPPASESTPPAGKGGDEEKVRFRKKYD